MLAESRVKTRIIDAVKRGRGYARRFEDKWSVGLPDMLILLAEFPVIFAEVKMIDGYAFGATPRQLVEMQRLGEHPNVCCVLIGFKDECYYFAKPATRVLLRDCIRSQIFVGGLRKHVEQHYRSGHSE